MRNLTHWFLTALLVVGILAVLAPSARAEDPCNPADPACAVTSEQGGIDGGISSGADGSTCRTRTHWIGAKNLLGQFLWKYFQKITWCSKGGKITSAERTRWAEVYALLWEFKGHLGSSISGGKGKTSYNAWTQGHFAACALNVCAQHKYPWIRQIGRADGTYAASAGV